MPTDSEAFAERVFGSMIGTTEVFGIYVGERLGLYRSLAQDGAATSAELADRVGMAERYAREWLEHQAAIGYLTVDDPSASADQRRFALPEAHAEVLVNPDSLMYLGGVARMTVASIGAMPALLEAYRTGGGVSWSHFGEDMFHGQGETNRPLFLASLGTEWLPQIPGVDEALKNGGRVADVGCGTGWSSIAIALAYPEATVDGFDIDDASVELAQRNAADMGVADRVHFYAQDAATADPGDGYDLALAFECIHDMPDPVSVLGAMRMLVGDRGRVVVVDEGVDEVFSIPASDIDKMMYGYSLMVCLPDGMAHEGSVGTGTVMRPATLRGYAQKAGFSDIEILPIEHEVFRSYLLVG